MQPVNTASCVYIAYTTACYRTRFTYRPPSLFLETKLVERLCDTKIGGYFRKSVYIASTLGVCVDVMILHVHRYGQPLFVIINEHNWKSTRVRGERIDADFFGTRQGKARQGKARQSKAKGKHCLPTGIEGLWPRRCLCYAVYTPLAACTVSEVMSRTERSLKNREQLFSSDSFPVLWNFENRDTPVQRVFRLTHSINGGEIRVIEPQPRSRYFLRCQFLRRKKFAPFF